MESPPDAQLIENEHAQRRVRRESPGLLFRIEPQQRPVRAWSHTTRREGWRLSLSYVITNGWTHAFCRSMGGTSRRVSPCSPLGAGREPTNDEVMSRPCLASCVAPSACHRRPPWRCSGQSQEQASTRVYLASGATHSSEGQAASCSAPNYDRARKSRICQGGLFMGGRRICPLPGSRDDRAKRVILSS